MGNHKTMLHYKGIKGKKIILAFLDQVSKDGGYLSESWGEFGVEDGWVTLMPCEKAQMPIRPDRISAHYIATYNATSTYNYPKYTYAGITSTAGTYFYTNTTDTSTGTI